MTKVYVMMFDQETKYASISLEAVEKTVAHQLKVFDMQRNRLGPRPIVWIKEVGEEEPIKTEVVLPTEVQWWVIFEDKKNVNDFSVNTRKEAREFVKWSNSGTSPEPCKVERREYALMKREVVS